MKMTYDPQADAAYTTLAEGVALESEEVAIGIVLDFDDQGRVLGIEVLHASKVLAPGALVHLPAAAE